MSPTHNLPPCLLLKSNLKYWLGNQVVTPPFLKPFRKHTDLWSGQHGKGQLKQNCRRWTAIDKDKATSKPLCAKWVFTQKINRETGKPETYKARWVAKGFLQKPGIKSNELYAGIAHKDLIQVFLSLVNYLDVKCDQVNIKATFLNGKLEETVFLQPPEGSNITSDKVPHLCKSFYGLKQSP